ncbi:hypothetical protein TNCV_1007451 [Trichonephila clavipes]|nr:hypothetical protein TNCV_1007451 [Trichonephila clavipes]
MLRIKRNGYQQVSEFNNGEIVAYRDCGLSFHGIAICIGRNPKTAMRYVIDGFSRLILNAMHILKGLPLIIPQRADMLTHHRPCQKLGLFAA